MIDKFVLLFISKSFFNYYNSSFSACVRKQSSFPRYSLKKCIHLTKQLLHHFHIKQDNSNDITGETYTTTDHLTTTSDIFKSCTWTSCSSPEAGGAIYLEDNYPLTLIDCSFLSCKSQPVSLPFLNGGGAIAFFSTGILTISSTSFISCSALGDRDCALHISARGDAFISNAAFIDCHSSMYGGGMLAEWNPSLSLAHSQFLFCSTNIAGSCGFYRRKSVFSVSNCLFSRNSANDSSRGGGAIEDYIYDPSLSCEYSFSFFTHNTAPVGDDLAVNNIAYSTSPLLLCCSASLGVRIYVDGKNTEDVNNWISQNILSLIIDCCIYIRMKNVLT